MKLPKQAEQIICDRCKDAFCCNYFVQLVHKDDKESREFYDVKGHKSYPSKHVPDALVYLIPEPCPHSVVDDEGKRRCDIYEDRPETCRKFPSRKRIYNFADVNAWEGWFDNCELLRQERGRYPEVPDKPPFITLKIGEE